MNETTYFNFISQEGLKGKVVAEYLLVPQNGGNITLPIVSFSYFDPIEGVYKTILSEPLQLNVYGSKNIPSFRDKPTVLKEIGIVEKIKENINSLFIIFAAFLLLLFTLYFILKRRKKKETIESISLKEVKDQPKTMNEKERLEELKQIVRENNTELYYEKQESFINDWLLIKTGLPQSKLDIQEVKKYFLSFGFSQENINELERIINNSKEAKYASIFQNNAVNLEEVHQQLVNIINKF